MKAFTVVPVVALAAIAACAQMNRDWEAQQAAQRQQQADAQPANMEQLCKAGQAAYCARCSASQDACSQAYVGCIGTSSPADLSAFNMGQVNQCAADIGQGDCGVMPGIWPASCSAPTPAPVADPPPAAAASPACPEGATWDGTQCTCPVGTGWNGDACVVVATPMPPPARVPDCRVLVAQKGFGPGAARSCQGAEPRCAEAVLNANFGPGAVENCRGVTARCAVAVIQHGFGPGALVNCRHVDGACAVAVLEQGNGPGAISACKR